MLKSQSKSYHQAVPWHHALLFDPSQDWPPASLLAQLVKNPSTMWETWVPSLSWEDPLEEGWLLSGLKNSMDSCPWGRKELDMTEPLSLALALALAGDP